MDNVILPEKVKYISRSYNLKREIENLNRLVGVLRRTVSRVSEISPSLDVTDQREISEIPGSDQRISPEPDVEMATESDVQMSMEPNIEMSTHEVKSSKLCIENSNTANQCVNDISELSPGSYASLPSTSAEQNLDPEFSEENSPEMSVPVIDFSDLVNYELQEYIPQFFGETEDNFSSEIDSEKNVGGKSPLKSTAFNQPSELDLLSLIDEIAVFSNEYNMTSQKNHSTEESADFSSEAEAFDLMTEVVEHSQQLDFSSLLHETDDVSTSIERVSSSATGGEPGFINKENLEEGTAEKQLESSQSTPAIGKGIPHPQYSQGSKSKETIHPKSFKLKVKGSYQIKYSDKMATFLDIKNFPRRNSKSEKREASVTAADDFNDTTDAVKSAPGTNSPTENDKRRRLRPLRTITMANLEDYKKKTQQTENEEKLDLQSLMASYYASLIDYKTEIRHIPDNSRVDNPDDGPMIEESYEEENWEETDTATCNTHRQLNVNKKGTNLLGSSKARCMESALPDIGPDMTPELRMDDEKEKRLFDKDALVALLEEKFQECKLSEDLSKFIAGCNQDAEDCHLPCVSKLLNKNSSSKNSGRGKASFVSERLNQEIRREVQEKIIQENIDGAHDLDEDVLVDAENDFILTVSLFHSIEKEYLSAEEMRLLGKPELCMELQVLSRNTLEQLCNNFLCYNDYVGLKELEHPRNYSPSELLEHNIAYELLPTATLLIDDTIYCNAGNGNCIDTGTVLKEWAASQPSKDIGPFKTEDLSKTLIGDLDIRFGYPYVYIHLGSCEHIVVFNQVRKISTTDSFDLRSYPVIKNHISFENIHCRTHYRKAMKYKNTKTSTCQYLARYAVLDYDRFPENPMLLCRTCVDSFCYDKKGKKVGTFKLYPFMQVGNVLQ